jgi:mRNA capping enzyme, beta chain
MADMVSIENNKPNSYESQLKTFEFQEMRKKLTSLREKVQKIKYMKKDNFNWVYPRRDNTKRRVSADSTYNKTIDSPVVKEKVKLRPIPHTFRKLKRVPPPNFMIGMRDLSRVYNDDVGKLVLYPNSNNSTII